MTRKSLLVVIIILSLVALPLIAHSSQDGVIFGRYSVVYFAAIVLYVIGLIGLIVSLFHMERVGKLIRDGADRIGAFQYRAFIEQHAIVILLAILALNGVGALVNFPAPNIFTDQPLLQYDYSFHYHQAATTVQSLSQFGKHWSYDMSFAAGYPAGTLFDLPMELFDLYVFGLTSLGVSIGFAYNSFILLCFVTYPILLYLAARCFGLAKSTSLFIVMTGVILWLSDFWIIIFYMTGMMPFAYGMYVALLCTGLFYRFLVEQKFIYFCLFTVVLALSFMVHVLVPLMLVVSLGVLYLYFIRKIKLSSHALIVLAVLIALAVNSWWMLTILRFLDYRLETSMFRTLNFTQFIYSFFDRSNTIPYILTFIGLWGYWAYYTRNKALALMGLCTVGWYFVVGKLGSNIPIVASLEPGRFVGPASVFAMFGLVLGGDQISSQINLKQIKMRIWLPVLIVLLMLSLGFLSIWTVQSNNTERGVVQEYKPLVDWVSTHTTRDARIAVSDDNPWFFKGAKLRAFVDRELIGGYSPEMNLAHIFANFSGGVFMRHQLSALGADDFIKYCKIYNIKWVVSAETYVNSILDTYNPSVKKVVELPGITAFTIYEVDIQPSFFISGSGMVSSSLNTINVSGASPGEVILGYHWLETLDTIPKLPIERVFVEDDPVGFIKVINGTTRDFVIYNSYEVNMPDEQKSLVDRYGKYLDIFRLSFWNP